MYIVLTLNSTKYNGNIVKKNNANASYSRMSCTETNIFKLEKNVEFEVIKPQLICLRICVM